MAATRNITGICQSHRKLPIRQRRKAPVTNAAPTCRTPSHTACMLWSAA